MRPLGVTRVSDDATPGDRLPECGRNIVVAWTSVKILGVCTARGAAPRNGGATWRWCERFPRTPLRPPARLHYACSDGQYSCRRACANRALSAAAMGLG